MSGLFGSANYGPLFIIGNTGGGGTGNATFKGAWSPSTNTPSLSDATGTLGDFYRTSVSDTINLGSGYVTYAIGDMVIHDGSIWQKIPGAGASFIGGANTFAGFDGSGNGESITGWAITDYYGANVSFPGAIAEDTTFLSLNNNGAITGYLNGVFVNHTGNVSDNVKAFNAFIDGDVINNVTLANLNFIGDAGSINGVYVSFQGSGNQGNVVGARMDFAAADTTYKSCFDFTMGSGDCSGGGRFMELSGGSGDYGNFIGINLNTGSLTTSSETGINIAKSSGLAGNYIALNINGSGPVTSDWATINCDAFPSSSVVNYSGIRVTPSAFTATGNVTGIEIDLSDVTSTNRPTALSVNGGIFGSYGQYRTTSGGFDIFNQLNPGLVIDSTDPITGTTVIGNNLANTLLANDDFGPGLLHVSHIMVGFLGAVEVASGKTVDAVSMAFGGMQLSGDGTVTTCNLFDAFGVLPNTGTPTLTDLYMFRGRTPTITPSNSYGVVIEDPAAENYFDKSLLIGDNSGKKVTNSSVALEVASLKAIRLPRLTSTERDALTALTGMFIYNTTLNKAQLYTASSWETVTST